VALGTQTDFGVGMCKTASPSTSGAQLVMLRSTKHFGTVHDPCMLQNGCPCPTGRMHVCLCMRASEWGERRGGGGGGEEVAESGTETDTDAGHTGRSY
jgi:hypothetical protein